MISEAPGATETGASLKDKHEFLITVLKDTYAGLIDFAFKHGAFLAIAMGWLVTSDEARKFLSENALARYSMTIALLLLTYFHYRWVGVFYHRSRDAYLKLQALQYMPDDYLALRVIPRSTFITFAVIHTAISLVICILALGLKLF